MFRLYYSDRASSIDTAPIAEARGSLYTEFTQSHASSISSDEYSSHFKKLKFYFIDEKSVTWHQMMMSCLRGWEEGLTLDRFALSTPQPKKEKVKRSGKKKQTKTTKIFFFKEWKDIKKSFPKTQTFTRFTPSRHSPPTAVLEEPAGDLKVEKKKDTTRKLLDGDVNLAWIVYATTIL